MNASWHPDEYLRRKPHLDVRQRVLAAVRGYFAAEDFAEVETPILQISPGNEVHLQAFATDLEDPRGGAAQKRYLHTSPEFAMKKLLVAGVPRLYQLAHTFRNGERSSLHHPEFLMLEWYRAHATLDAIMEDCESLVCAVATIANRKIFTANNMTCDVFADWERLSVPDAFQRYAGIDLMAFISSPPLAGGTEGGLVDRRACVDQPPPSPPASGRGALTDTTRFAAEARRIGVHVSDGDTWDDLFFRIMGEKIEPYLGNTCPTFLCDYPIAQAALARPKASDPRLAERFELYICGIELANAFGELTDAAEQQRRFQVDMDLKEKLYGTRYPIDPDFIAALAHGMPESAGIALGFDRLVMLAAGANRVEDVMWLPVG